MQDTNTLFQLPENTKENIVQANLLTKEALENTIASAMGGDLKAQVAMYDICAAYKENLFQNLQNAQNDIYIKICKNEKPDIEKNIADRKLEIYNDEIKKEFFNEDYSGKYLRVIYNLREDVRIETEEELNNLMYFEEQNNPLVQNIRGEIDALAPHINGMRSALSDQHFVFDMQEKEKGYFPSFEESFICENDYLSDVLHAISHETNNHDLIEKFGLLANLQLPEREGIPNNDQMEIKSISDIKGDFDKDGDLSLHSFTVEQRSTSWHCPIYAQKLSFDFQTGQLHVSGTEREKDTAPQDASQYAYHIPIAKVDGRILDLQQRLDAKEQKLDTLSFADQFLMAKEIGEIEKQIKYYMAIDENAQTKNKELNREDHEDR